MSSWWLGLFQLARGLREPVGGARKAAPGLGFHLRVPQDGHTAGISDYAFGLAVLAIGDCPV